MNKAEKIEAEKLRHEYDLMDRRLGEQRVIDEIKEHIKIEITPRIISLEHFRTRIYGILIGLAAAWGAIKAWFKYGHHLKI